MIPASALCQIPGCAARTGGKSGVGPCSLRDAADPTAPESRLTFHTFATRGELEADVARERTLTVPVAPRRQGRRLDLPRAPPSPA